MDKHIISGQIPSFSQANNFPVRPNPVATSSIIRSTLYFSVSSRTPLIYPLGCINIPAAACTRGSIIIAATYNERTSVEDIQKIIEELINLKNEIEEELKAGNEFNLSSEEKAFFDALGDDPEVKELMKDEILVQIAKELVETVNSNMTIDWDIRKDARAKMRIEIKKLLIKYNYPPNKSEKAVQTVIRQAELKCKEMIE